MRSDMYKVIVERPRKWKTTLKEADRLRKDFEGPSRLGMRRGLGRPALNENLSPLKRYLRAQIGRPWNKVYGEISAGIDRRNTVQQHVFAHIEDFIATQVERRDGRWVNKKDRLGTFWMEGELRQEMYVDPRTGLIRANKAWRSYIARRRALVAAEEETIAARRRRIDAHTALMLIEGQWYEVKLAIMPAPQEVEYVNEGKLHRRSRVESVFDAVLKRKVNRREYCDLTERRELYGGDYIYAVSKRQLSRREIVAHELPATI